MENRKAFVLGGTGFIGQELVYSLINSGIQVCTLVHKSNLPSDIINKTEKLKGSITNFDWKIFNYTQYDVIYHLARITGRGGAGRYISACRGWRANNRLLKSLKYQQNIPLLVYVAGTLAYGSRGEDQVTETELLIPSSFAKQYCYAEEPVLKAILEKMVPGIIIRAPWVMGYGSWLKKFFIDPVISENIVPQYGEGSNWMSLIHVRDCALQIRHITKRENSGYTYNILPAEYMRQKDFVSLISRITGAPVKVYSRSTVKRLYGEAVSEAFMFSLRAATCRPQVSAGFNFNFNDTESALRDILKQSKVQVKNER